MREHHVARRGRRENERIALLVIILSAHLRDGVGRQHA
jgi:hypothetical protein